MVPIYDGQLDNTHPNAYTILLYATWDSRQILDNQNIRAVSYLQIYIILGDKLGTGVNNGQTILLIFNKLWILLNDVKMKFL